ncbi:hypothetical protein IMZ48_22985 [Candidatus Bathyarchaeota archaeon]|nr:hypothetical protein [Candidatus Bathyarchaeota archaeon]
MKLTIFPSVMLYGLAAAAPGHSEPKGHNYRPEEHGDRESPIPSPHQDNAD